jgi:anti-sigma regulatory factor (Ser/Thr protein kinase)
MTAGGISLRIPATLESLGLVQAFVGEHAGRLGLGTELAGRLELVVEELVVNIGSYAYPQGGGDMEVDCVLSPDANRFCLILRDWGAAFDPLEKAAPDLEGGLDEREPGGLGIFLVREMADECTYRRSGDMNEFRACFALPKEEQA